MADKPTTRSERYRRAMEGMTIRNEEGNLVPMKFSPSQNIIWQYVKPQLDNRDLLWFIVLKARQIYATTFFENLTFIRTLEKPNTNSLIIAQDLDSASAIFEMAKRFYDNLPLPPLKPPKVKEIDFPFPGGSSKFKVVSAGTAAKGRGTTQSCVHCSEVAFWPNADVMLGLFQAMPKVADTIWVLESTANGLVGDGAMFYDQWKLAVSGASRLIPIFIPWFVMPKYRNLIALPEDEWDDEESILVNKFAKWGLDGHSLAWRRETISTKTQGSIDKFHQEYPSTPTEAFIFSGFPAFDPLAILDQEDYVKDPIERGELNGKTFTELRNGELQVWKRPEDGHIYFIGVDCAEGLRGGDYACAQVVDFTTMEQVALIHGTIQPWDFARMLADLGKWYNTAMINIEIKSSGWAVQDYLIKKYMYPILHPWHGRSDHIKMYETKLYGFDTNAYSRPLLIEAGRHAINKRILRVRDRATLDELSHFSKSDEGKYEAQAGHDDRVMALLLALRSGVENFQGSRATVYNLEMSEPDSYGVRVIHADDFGAVARKKMHDLLIKDAQRSTKQWMGL